MSLPFPPFSHLLRAKDLSIGYLLPDFKEAGWIGRCFCQTRGLVRYGSIKVARAVHDSTECSATYGDKDDSRSCLTPVCKKTTSGRPVGAKDLVRTMKRRKSKYLSQTKSNWEPLLVVAWACDDVTSVAHT